MTQILIVEDNADLAFGLSTSLEVEGYEVAVANDGPAGLTAARERNPDVIILDLMLPGLDGYRVLRTLREEGREMPVLILTARGAWSSGSQIRAHFGLTHRRVDPLRPRVERRPRGDVAPTTTRGSERIGRREHADPRSVSGGCRLPCSPPEWPHRWIARARARRQGESLAYRRPGIFSRHFKQTASRSASTRWFKSRGGTGSLPSAQSESGGYHQGSRAFHTIEKRPSGVGKPRFPVPIRKVRTSRMPS